MKAIRCVGTPWSTAIFNIMLRVILSLEIMKKMVLGSRRRIFIHVANMMGSSFCLALNEQIHVLSATSSTEKDVPSATEKVSAVPVLLTVNFFVEASVCRINPTFIRC